MKLVLWPKLHTFGFYCSDTFGFYFLNKGCLSKTYAPGLKSLDEQSFLELAVLFGVIIYCPCLETYYSRLKRTRERLHALLCSNKNLRIELIFQVAVDCVSQFHRNLINSIRVF